MFNFKSRASSLCIVILVIHWIFGKSLHEKKSYKYATLKTPHVNFSEAPAEKRRQYIIIF